MKELTKKPLWRVGLTLTSAFMMGLSIHAQAQEEPAPAAQPVESTPSAAEPAKTTGEVAKLDTVEVTGSRIKGVDLEVAQPVIVITRKDIDKSGLTSTGEVLRRLAIAGPSLTNTAPLQGSGQVEVDLRNLGSQRVLVLVNGRRWVNGVTRSGISDAVDLTTIPLAVVERMEVLKDGAAALYGSDALAGVINVITRKAWDGIGLETQWGQFSEGDGETTSHSLTTGSSTDKTTTILNLSFTRVNPFFESDRRITNDSTFGFPDVNFYGASGITRFGRYIVPGRSEPSLTLITGEDGREASDFRAFNNMIDGEDTSPFSYVQTPRDTQGLFGAINYQLLPNLSFEGELLYNNRSSNQFIAPIPITLGSGGLAALPGSSVAVSSTNAFNPFGVDIGNPAAGGGNVTRRIVETGPRRFFQDIDTYHVGLGLRGDFELATRQVNWDASYYYSRVHNSQTTTGQGNIERIARAVGPAANCTGAEPIPCIPLNLFGAPGSITQPMLAYSFAILNGRQEQKTQGYSANLSTALAQLPAGALQMAAGLEYREESGGDTPDPLEALGISTGNNRKPTGGSYDVKEAFLEFQIPVLADKPFLDRLDLNLALRNSGYTIGARDFSVTTSKAGLQYRPIGDLLIRMSYAEGFKAPTITNLFGGGSDNFATINDPCANTAGTGFASINAAGQAKCVADGVPTGGYTQPNPQIRISSGAGNANLDPEEGESLVYGLVYSPSFLPGFTATLDVYSYEIENTIALVGGQTILTNCYQRNIDSFCGFVTRNPGVGNVLDLKDGFINFARTKTNGFDARFDYKWPTFLDGRFGQVSTALDLSYLDQYRDFLPTFTGSSIEQKREGRATFTGAFARVKSNLSADWNLNAWSASYLLRYIDSVNENCGKLQAAADRLALNCAPGANDDGTADVRQRRMRDAMYYHDVQVGYELERYNTQFNLGISNLLDEDPPPSYAAGTGSGGFSPFLYDIPGQSYYLRVKVAIN